MNNNKFKLLASVYLMLVNDKNEVLLLRRFKTGYQDGNYSLPAGHVDGGENIKQAMIREAWEETGIQIKEEDLTLSVVLHRICEDNEYVEFFFKCVKWEGVIQNAEPHKCDELQFYPLDGLPENTLKPVKICLTQLNACDIRFLELDERGEVSPF